VFTGTTILTESAAVVVTTVPFPTPGSVFIKYSSLEIVCPVSLVQIQRQNKLMIKTGFLIQAFV
jgi:hypothetical protein